MLVILFPSSTTRVWITKTLVGEEDDDIDGGEGDGEDDKKDNAGHLVPVEHHKGLSRKDGDECDDEIRI